uniref:Uncharacterized protein n=1 Tax=viral metagenome TaxID=1070528 RepID=A0A6M3Y206_9ZZZZ
MTERTFDLQVSGFTRGGYGVTLLAREVAAEKLGVALEWLGVKMTEAGILPDHRIVQAENGGNGNPPEVHLCPIHKVPMEYHEKGKSHWWSHKVTMEDGTEHWCRGK